MADILYPHHRLSLDAHLGALHLHLDLELSAPWTVLFGPSGSGKSSILHAACGLLPQAATTFTRRTSPVPKLDTSQLPRMVASTWQTLSNSPPHLRNLAYAPQSAALFPHLTVLQNIAFATACRPRNPASQALIDAALDLFQLAPLTHRYPRDLSGGERQRVSLARALAVPQPRLVLLDEPFTGIHRALRDTLLPAMQHHLASRNIPVLSVTHDVEEALRLNAEVIRLDSGQVTAHGPAPQVLAPERASILHALTTNH